MSLDGIKRKKATKKEQNYLKRKKMLWILVSISFIIIFIFWILTFKSNPSSKTSSEEPTLGDVLNIEKLKEEFRSITNQTKKVKKFEQLTPQEQKFFEKLEKQTFSQFENENK